MKKRFIFILLLSTFIFIYISGLFNIMIGLIKGYSFNTITVFKENENIKNIITNKYSKTLEVAVNSNNYQEKYLDEYLNINYVKDNDFIININALLDRGYNEKEINSIYSNVNMTDIYTFLNYDYNKKNIDILNVKYFKNNLKYV